MAFVGSSSDFKNNNFLLSLKQQQYLVKIMFSCIHFPEVPYSPKIMKEKNVFYTGKQSGLTGMKYSK